MSRRRQIFIVGHDEANLEHLRRLPQATQCDFHPALHLDEIRGVDTFDIPALVERAAGRMAGHDGPVDGVVAWYDFPASTLVPILAERFGVPGPTLESVLKCEHKYWSRLEQQEAIPGHVPRFAAFDPCRAHTRVEMPLSPPFWIKPIKAFRSHLGFLVNDECQFREYAREMCAQLDYMVEPFRELVRRYHMPVEIANMEERCLAESVIGGAQCTAEGYVLNDGEIVIHGIVDSVREGDRTSFTRYQYPSVLPDQVQHRIADLSRRVITRTGLRNACFNIEYFWDQAADHLWLLEINPRLSQSHAEIFELVHGCSHQSYMIDLALGHRPRPLPEDGPFRLAANCHLRVFQTGRVIRVPDRDELERIAREIPGTSVRIHVRAGQDVSELPDQDSYSFQVGNVFVGADSERELLDKYHRVLDMLNFEIGRSDHSLDLHATA